MDLSVLSAEPKSLLSTDWQRLRNLSLRPGGFQDERTQLWPQLLDVDATLYPTASNGAAKLAEDVMAKTEEDDAMEGAEPHPDERQVRLDTDRSFVLYPVVDMNSRIKQQNELYDLITKVFRKRRRLSYFQGYHDIISVLYLTMPSELQFPCAEKISLYRVRDSMGASLEPIVGLLRVLQRLLRIADSNYAELLEQNAPLPYFALSNLLTLFSHDMPTLPLIQHVFDYLLCRPPICVVYLAAALILSRKQEVERLQEEGEEGMIHSLLSGLPDLFDGEDPPHEVQVDVSVKEEVEQSRSECDPERTVVEEEHIVPATDLLGEERLKSLTDIPTKERSIPDDPTLLSEEEDTLVESSVVEEEEDKASSHAVLDASQSSDSPLVCENAQAKSEVQEEPVNPATNVETSIAVEHSPDVPSPSHSRDNSGDSSSSEDLPLKPRIPLSSLLERADELFLLYPPSHPSINLSSIMGPQSVMLTWSEKVSELPNEEEAELMVTQPQLIVLPPEEIETKEETETEDIEARKAAKRRRRKLRKPVRIGSVVVEQRTVVASAVLVLGVAMAVYGLQATPDRHHGASREFKKLTRYVGGLMLGFGGRLWDRLLTDR